MAVVSFLNLTDADEVRSVIGIDDEEEITDGLISDRKPEEDLEVDLVSWVPAYQTVIEEGLADSPTDTQRQNYLLLRTYAKYFIAELVVSAGINSILQKQSDGSNEAIRFTNVNLAELKDTLKEKAENAKGLLYKALNPSATRSYSLFGTVSPDYDPVTNETT